MGMIQHKHDETYKVKDLLRIAAPLPELRNVYA